MQWRKMGRIFAPDGRLAWARKYAFPPTPVPRADGSLRIFLACCDERTVGRIGYVDLDPNEPSRVLRVSERPVLDIGSPGSFDENGVLPTSILNVDGRLYMYYVGYQLGQKVRYYQFQGLAVSDDGGESFVRLRRTPVIDRSDHERLHRTSAFVMREDNRFRMWYVAGDRWLDVKGKSLPVYNLRHLESADGVRWGDEGRVCLDFANEDEHAFGRPWLLREAGGYRMFYSVRTQSRGYRLGFADSPDGLTWRRRDAEVGIDVSPGGWDSEMIAYGSVHRHGDKTYLFYNGNNCGETGFGYAILEAA